MIILDIETNTKHDRIWICCVKDVQNNTRHTFQQPTAEFHRIISSAKTIVGHNIVAFDAPVLNMVWGTKIKLSQCFDTLLMSRLSNPERQGHGLEDWGKRLGNYKTEYGKIWAWLNNVPYDKNSVDCFNFPHMALLESYCRQDVEVTHEVYKAVKADLEGFSDSCIALEHRVQQICWQQEQNGFMLDVPKLQAFRCQLEMEMMQIETEMQTVFQPIVHKRVSEKTGKPLQDKVEVFNVGSRQQIASRLMSLGWEPTKRTEKGSVIVDETTLETLPYPEAKLIARFLMLQKRLAMVVSWLEKVDDDNRIRGRVITIGAVSNRCTHSNPNLAQVPAVRAPFGLECRSSFTVPDGKVLIGADLSGIELRCLAHYMNDLKYTEALLKEDIHWTNAKAFGFIGEDVVYNEHIDECKKARNNSKTAIYALCYGAGDAKMGSIIGKGAKDGKRIKEKFYRAMPAFKRLKDKVERIGANGTLPGLDGRLLHVRSEHSALNTLLQGAGAIIAKQWMVCCNDNLKKAKIPFKQVAFVHDELEFEVDPQYAEIAGKIIVTSATEAGIMLGVRCRVDAEYKLGKTWADVH